MNWRKALNSVLDFFAGLSRALRLQTVEGNPSVSASPDKPPTANDSPPPSEPHEEQPKLVVTPPKSAYPEMNTTLYRVSLKETLGRKGHFPRGYEPIADDPGTAENERRTFCNFFVREVAAWKPFNWRNFEAASRDQAGEITVYMKNHPEVWEKVNSQEKAQDHASKGRLVIAGYVYPKPNNVKPGDWHASGHVCIVAPEPVSAMLWSSTFNQKVCIIANVGSKNFYGKLSFAFKPTQAPDFFVYKGRQA